MHNLRISKDVIRKLEHDHVVNRREVEQCFQNKCGLYLIDSREKNQTDPPTLWFVAPTNAGRLLKTVFILKDGNVHLKTAYNANEVELDLYDRLGK